MGFADSCLPGWAKRWPTSISTDAPDSHRLRSPTTVETHTRPSSGGLVLTVTKERYIYMEDNNVNLYLLESRIRSYFVGKEKKVVFIRADKDVPYGYVISVLDVIKRAGVETVGMIVDKKDEK